MFKEPSLISIVVPVYNTEQYLSKCIESILNQTYQEFEIILINDGSTDSSGKICDNFAQKDNRIKVIHKKNSGVSDSRNIGIGEAKGKFLVFVDSDDWIASNMIECLVSYQEKHDADLVLCGYNNVFYNQKNTREKAFFLPDEFYSDRHFFDCFGKYYQNSLINSPCNKLYRADIIHNQRILFDTALSLGEDLLFNLKYFEFCVTVCNTQNCLYYYRHMNSSSSLTKKFDELKLEKQANLREQVIEFCSTYSDLNKQLPFINAVYFSRIQTQIKNIIFSPFSFSEKYRYLKKAVIYCNSLSWGSPVLISGKLQKFVYMMIKNKQIVLLYFYFSAKRWYQK